MVAFQNSFFSLAGQVERLKNVGAVLSQSLNPLSKAKPTVDTNIVKNTVLQSAATALVQHPFVTAAVVAAPLSSGVRSAAVSGFTSLSPVTKLGVVAAGVVGGGALVSSPKAQAATIKAVSSTPSGLLNFGSNIGKFAENPSTTTLTNIFKENPIISTATAAGAGLLLAKGAIGTAATISNTLAVKENTKATSGFNIEELTTDTAKSPQQSYNVIDKSGELVGTPINQAVATAQPPTPQTATVSKSVTPKRKKLKRAVLPTVNQKVNVIVNSRATSTGVKTYLKRGILAYT